MFKAKIAAFVAALAVAASAQASWTQYDFDPASGISGYFVQDDGDKSIAYYDFTLSGLNGGRMFPSGGFNNLTGASTHYTGAGPTSFALFDDLSDVTYNTLDLYFASSSTAGRYHFRGWYSATPIVADSDLVGSSRMYRGVVNAGAVNAPLLSALEYLREQGQRIDGLNHIVPIQVAGPAFAVPEPGSLALLALAGLGLAGVRRRSRAA